MPVCTRIEQAAEIRDALSKMHPATHTVRFIYSVHALDPNFPEPSAFNFSDAMLVTVDQIADKSFDYVIIGGGTAGLVLAARLTEDSDINVVVLEAGAAHINDPQILRPASYASHFGNEEYDWGYRTVPQKWASETVFKIPSGKGLGGSSGINFYVWSRPPAAEIDDFERLGNPGWNWKDFEKYSRRVERFIAPPPDDAKKGDLRAKGLGDGTTGMVPVAFTKTLLALQLPLQQAMLKAGFKHAENPLGGDNHGVAFFPQTVDPASCSRSYSTNSYYLPVQDRKNLKVLVNAPVSRIITERNAEGLLVAKEVEFDHDGKARTVKVGKEAIVSAGSLRSPQILELSGIGLKSVLEPLRIPVQLELPVGENVQDHIFIGTCWELRDGIDEPTLDIFRDPEQLKQHMLLHAEGKGLFSTGLSGIAYGPLHDYSDRAEEIYKKAKETLLKNADSYPPGLLEQYKIQIQRMERKAPGIEMVVIPGFLSAPNRPEPGKKYYTILLINNQCQSRGTVHITSTDPKVHPALDPHYLEQAADLQCMVEGTRFVRKLRDVEPFKDLIAKEKNPGPEVQTDEQIAEWVKKCMSTTYHTACTLPMLPRDKGGVVDPKLKVYGTENIRVADFSIIPLHFSSHPQSVAYAVGEKAADIIKGVI